MEESASAALMMAFGIFVFVIALSLSIYMFSQVTNTAEILTSNADSTKYYDNVAVIGKEGIVRYVNTETIIPTLYRYYKENFCVKIYDATGDFVKDSSAENPGLIQIFDIKLETDVATAVSNSKFYSTDTNSGLKNSFINPDDANDASLIKQQALRYIYNDSSKVYYLFGAPWLSSTEDMKERVDFFVNGSAGYINSKWVDYLGNPFSQIRKCTDQYYQFEERFENYSYSGSTMETDDGDVLITGNKPEDKTVITYTLVKIEDTTETDILEQSTGISK